MSVILALFMVEPKTTTTTTQIKHAHFNIDELKNYDKTRGQKTKIDDS